MSRRDAEFEEFFAAQSQRLCRLALLLTGDPVEAEELAQEVMVRTYRVWHRIGQREGPAAYARTVLLNHRRSLARRARVARRYTVLERNIAEGVGEEHVGLLLALRGLPRRQRQALVLRYYEDLSEAEIAAALDCPNGTVKSLLRRGLARLREGLGEELEAKAEKGGAR